MMIMPSLFLLVFVLLLFPSTTLACGGFFCEPARPVVQSGEAIVFGVNGDKVTMYVQILYEGPAEGFSWLLPMPVQPDEISVGSDLMFTALFQGTLPRWEMIVNTDPNDSCSEDALVPDQCFARESAGADDSAAMLEEAEEDGAIVLEQGSVGPFDFVVLEAADNNPNSVLEWLNENGYDQPEGSAPLLNYYAVNDHVFVALRLQKEAETGEIQPLILEYTMPGGGGGGSGTGESATQVSRRAMACVPIQLTSIAATDNMPIQVYIFGQARAVPLNFVELQLDDNQVDWVGCNNNPGCHDDLYRERFDRAASQLVNHSFVTEFAGSESQQIYQGTIEIQVTQDEIAAVTSMDDFLRNIGFRLPFIPLVDTIVTEFRAKEEEGEFDATALAQELEDKLLKPARDAQAFVDGFPYMTRLYARLGPDYMTKDPFFAFKPELPPVDNVHRATAVPICSDGSPSALTITVEETGDSMVVPVTRTCGIWSPVDRFVWDPNQSTAVQLASWGFQGDPGIIVSRLEDGTFDSEEITVAIDFGDSLVMNQTIPQYVPQALESGPSSPSTTTPGEPTPSPVFTTPPSSSAWKTTTLQFAPAAVIFCISLVIA